MTSKSLKRPSILDVAREAGVSRSTASRALRGEGYVSEVVRARITDAIERLGYVADEKARSLRTLTSTTLGLVVSDLRNPFYAELAASVSNTAREFGFTTIVADGSGDNDLEGVASMMVAMRVAGVIVTPVSAGLTTRLVSHGVQVVEVDRRALPEGSDGVVVDNLKASFDATTALLNANHRRIGIILDETHWTTGRDRMAGFRAAFEARGERVDEALICYSGWNENDATDAASKLLTSALRPTAVFAANNVLAVGVWRAAQRLQLAIPGDLSIAAFDDMPWMSMVDPPISAVSQPTTEMGAVATRLLVERVGAPYAPPTETVLPTRWIERNSIAAPAAS